MLKETTLNRFKKVFEEQRSAILYNDKVLRDDFAVNEEDRFDEVDQATTDVEQSMRMRLRNRERLYLKKIEEALERIADGTFGECSSCGGEIGIGRLRARPTATLCVSCKEEEERKEVLTAAGLKHKSLGVGFKNGRFV